MLIYVLSGLILALPRPEHRPPRYHRIVITPVCRIYLAYLAAILISSLLSGILSMRASIGGLSDWVNKMKRSQPITNLVLADNIFSTGYHS